MSQKKRLWPTPKAQKVGGYSSPQFRPTLEQVVNSESPSSLVASPVNLTRLQESVKALLTSVISGRSSGVSLARLNPDGSWQKMYQEYSQVMLDGSLEPFSMTWPKWGTLLDGLLTEQLTWVRYIDETESLLWATPNTLDSMPPKSAEALHREATIARPGRSQPANLRDQVSNQKTLGASDGAHIFRWRGILWFM